MASTITHTSSAEPLVSNNRALVFPEGQAGRARGSQVSSSCTETPHDWLAADTISNEAIPIEATAVASAVSIEANSIASLSDAATSHETIDLKDGHAVSVQQYSR